MSQYQLLPYERIKDHFESQMDIPLSVGSIYNFNKSAYERLEGFEQWLIQKLIKSDLNHADETGINIDGKRHSFLAERKDNHPLLSAFEKETHAFI